ncbi:MAG: hypothetical protein K2G14_03740 [Ruminococcus sp.]|nr:hypothetical protein [Ruminococcus sp.]
MNPDLHKGHRERFRQRFIDTDGNGFCQHEILELLLFYALPRVNTNETAHLIFDKAGSFSDVFELSIEELCSIKGVSQSASSFLRFIADIARKYTDFPNYTASFDSIEDINGYFLNFFASYDSDMCLVMNISQCLELINTICFSMQEINMRTSKEIASDILKINPNNIIIGIYRPSTFVVPLPRDYSLCKKLSTVLAALEIPFLDLIICNKTETFSMRQKGAYSF